jgi:lipopolysaccharide biosynthesis regulator YciM
LKAENERLRKGLLDEGYVIKAEAIEKKAPQEFVEYEGEQINKADIPAPILKALESAEIEKADMVLTKKAEETLPHFSVEVAKGLLSAVSKMDEAEMLIEALIAADKAFSDKMEEFGKADVDGEFSSASDKVERLVKSHMEEYGLTKKDYAKAYAAVAKTEEGKSLIAKAYKGD